MEYIYIYTYIYCAREDREFCPCAAAGLMIILCLICSILGE